MGTLPQVYARAVMRFPACRVCGIVRIGPPRCRPVDDGLCPFCRERERNDNEEPD
jgi:hypothetical protein